MAALASASRAKVLTEFARRCDAARHPDTAFADVEPGERVDGRRRAPHMAPYDWQRDGRRVACKSAQLKWNDRSERWVLLFQNIKPEACDELLLAAYTPEGVHLFQHNRRAGLSTNGKSTAGTGKGVTFYGPRDEPDWRVALGEILEKVKAKGCRRLALVPWHLTNAYA